MAYFTKTVFFAFVSAVGIWIGMMVIDIDPPYTWDGPASRVIPDPAPDGGRVLADWKITVHRICPASSQRRLSDPNTRRLDANGEPIPHTGKTLVTYDPTPASVSVQPGEASVRRTFVLPRGLPSTVAYDARVCFSCNLYQHIVPLCLTTPEIIFGVIPSKEPSPAEPYLMEPR